MTDKKGSDNEIPSDQFGVAASSDAEAALLGKLRNHLSVLRGQVRKLNESLADLNGVQVLEPVPPVTADVPGDVQHLEPTAAARVAALKHAPSSIKGEEALTISHQIGLSLGDIHVRALTRSGVLKADDTIDTATVENAVQKLLDAWANRYVDTNSEAVEQSKDGDRRAGRDRRRNGKRFNSLLSHIEGSPLDRRKSLERRAHGERRSKPRGKAAAARASEKHKSVNVVDIGAYRDDRKWKKLSGNALPDQKSKSPRADSELFWSRGSGLGEGGGGVNEQTQPNESKSDQTIEGKWLPVHEHSEQKVTRGREVLEEPDGRKSDTPGGSDE
jgi:hypothetical protein